MKTLGVKAPSWFWFFLNCRGLFVDHVFRILILGILETMDASLIYQKSTP